MWNFAKRAAFELSARVIELNPAPASDAGVPSIASGGGVTSSTLLDQIIMISWPLGVFGAAYLIARWALSEKDEITSVVEALTTPVGGEQDAAATLCRPQEFDEPVTQAKPRTMRAAQ